MFRLIYLNVCVEPCFFSETRVYRALLMGAAMAIIMLAYMAGMNKRKRINTRTFVGSATVFVLWLWLVAVRRPSRTLLG